MPPPFTHLHFMMIGCGHAGRKVTGGWRGQGKCTGKLEETGERELKDWEGRERNKED